MTMRFLALQIICLVAANVHAANRPNIVWLISEDNSMHYLKLYVPYAAGTPRIAKLAEHGLVFDHAFSNAPVCSVARTSLITSCYGPRIGTQFHRCNVPVPMPEELKMFPAYLREAGYYTTNKSKTDYNAIESQGTWDASSAMASWRDRRSGQPFFHKQTFTTTHESSLHFAADTMANERTVADPTAMQVAPYHPDTPIFRYAQARYHDRIRQVDREIGQVVDQLVDDGLLEDTFIFYFSDHGGVLPRGKGYAYESGLHIPLVVRVPEKWKMLVDRDLGSRVQGFVSHVDLGPTVLQLAGVNTPKQVDGRPFLGSGISALEVDQRDEAFGYADRFDEKYDLVRTLRRGKYEYVRSYQPFNFDGLQNNYRYNMLAYQQWRELFSSGKLNEVQQQFFRPREPEMLFDVEQDPFETNNLATDPKYADVLADLRQRMQQRVKEMPDLSFFPESYLVAKGFGDPVAFGLDNKSSISTLVDIADLELLSWEFARPSIEQALATDNPWQRYWGLIVCSRFGKRALAMTDKAKELAQSDDSLLVRTRAAEFLALAGVADPAAVLKECLAKTESGVEAALILNTWVLLRDGRPGKSMQLTTGDLNPLVRSHDSVMRRMEYLDPQSPSAEKSKQKRGKKQKASPRR